MRQAGDASDRHDELHVPGAHAAGNVEHQKHQAANDSRGQSGKQLLSIRPARGAAQGQTENAGMVMKFGIRRLFTSKTDPTIAQAAAVAGYVNSI